jgi:Fic family protein
MADQDLYSDISKMEPMFPTSKDSSLTELSIEVIRRSAALSTSLHPKTRMAVTELVRSMNSYYSNLIEGHNTHPVDIERALEKNYSYDPAMRAMQMESAAHIDVQRLIEGRLHEQPDEDICGQDFLSWIHSKFYERLPEEFCKIQTPEGKSKIVIPGKLRQHDVTVGRHLAPAFKALPNFLTRFQTAYSPLRLNAANKVIAAAASHHRLAWIHPFLEGNGRVTRLFTHAFLIRAQIDGHGLWNVSRGFARNRNDYLAALAGADEHRQGDMDGRGNLSNRGLVSFCTFFLQIAMDQINFMSDLLEIDGLQKRIEGYVARQVSFDELKPEAFYLLREALLRGEIPRGEASRITGLPERTARRILKSLLEKKLLIGDSEKSPVRLSFPAKVAGYYFPRLYPEGVEITDA